MGRVDGRRFGVRFRRVFELFDKRLLYLFPVKKIRDSLSFRRILGGKEYFVEFLSSANLDFCNNWDGGDGRVDYFGVAR